MTERISCPVSNILVNENRVRITALFVFLSSSSYLLAPYWAIPAFLVIDFFLRGFGWGRYSPFNALSGWIVKKFSIGNKPIDQAPKLFAAQLGFTFSSLLLISAVFSLLQTGYVIASILVLFSFLESALGFCAGCHVYTIIRKIFPAPVFK
jgi:hypothetical protein